MLRAAVIVVAMLATSAFATQTAAAPRPLVFVLAGQSNMVGYDTAPNPAIGPGVSFSTAIAERTGTAPTLIQCAVSGSPLSAWVPGGDLYQACMQKIGGTHVDGLLFWQGESEASDATLASSWSSRFATMVAGFRHDLGNPDLPVMFAQLDTPTTDPSIIPYWSVVQAQQAATSLPNAVMVVTSDQSTLGEHVTAEGQVVVGRRFAAAWLETAWTTSMPVPPPASPAPPPPAPTPAPTHSPGRPPTPVVLTVDEASWSALQSAKDAGASDDIAALEARSAGENALYATPS